jgi:hypothetical protein
VGLELTTITSSSNVIVLQRESVLVYIGDKYRIIINDEYNFIVDYCVK